MDQEVNEKSKKRRIKLYYGLLVSIVCIIGVSFAWFRLYLSQSENNTLASRTCFSTTLTEDTSKIALTDAFPISDADGLKRTPFTFTLKNNCDSYVKVYITIDSTYRESTDTSYLKDSYMKVNVSPKDTTSGASKILGSQTLTDLENDRKGYIIVSTGLSANEEKSYDLRVWMDSETTLNEGLNKNWAGKIVVVSNASNLPLAPNGWYDAGSNTLLAAIRSNNDVTEPITNPGSEISDEKEAVLASTEDDYGTSYYFRGAVKNNYVQFANKCWRVVRIDGAGDIKLILHNDNTNNSSSPCSSTNNNDDAAFAHYNGTTYKSAFNTNDNDNAYVGFMYGTAGSSDYASTHANINKSTILTNLETWYNNNLAAYESKLKNVVWCEDKTPVTDTTYDPWKMLGFTGLGYGTERTYYSALQRIQSYDNQPGGTGVSLMCNGDLSKLTKYVGLLTGDEAALAGNALAKHNTSIYLYENTGDGPWWLLSPAAFDGGTAYAMVCGSGFGSNFVFKIMGVRPSVVLPSSTTISGGKGTSEAPYVVN